ncbi:substrate-binding domain-containing protein [Streptomyces sp. WAC 04229]|uniref:substrate-binding domain-containing protein n=1 Tax=Streptomyces sp. WAC 04229 TaxID=2203206 RepID=UPI003D74221A
MTGYDPRGKANRALLVGVSEYDNTAPPDGVPGDLPAVKHNLNRLSEALRHGGVFDEREITVCRSPDQGTFDQELWKAANEADGVLLLYFAGHGAIPNAGDELFLQMRNARVVAGGHAVFPGAVLFSLAQAMLTASSARRIVVVLDCCFAGNAAWVRPETPDKRRLLLMSVQPNHRIDAGDPDTPTPFTAELVKLLEAGGDVSFRALVDDLRAQMSAAGHRTVRGDAWEPESRAEPGIDVLLAAGAGGPGSPPAPDPAQGTDPGPGAPDPGPGLVRRVGAVLVGRLGGMGAAWGALIRRRRDSGARESGGGDGKPGVPTGDTGDENATRRDRRRTRRLVAGGVAMLVLVVTAIGIGTYRHLALTNGPSSCAPPLELRVLTDPDLEPTVRAAADAYLTSEANTTGDDCRRSGITVYSAGAADAVTALRKQTGAWQEPREADTNPQRDVGPQPDVWIPASPADAARAVAGQDTDAVAELDADQEPFAYSPVVLAVPQGIAVDELDDRTGPPLTRMIDDLRARHADAAVRRPDPEFTDTGLLATIALYATQGAAGAADPRRAEDRVAQSGPPAPTAAEMLCALPDDDAVDNRTAALVPEFLLKSGVGCDSARRAPRMAQYPGDVPGLEPVFVRVRWQGADRDQADRNREAEAFREWLTGEGGRVAFARDGFRAATGNRALLDSTEVAEGVLRAPSPLKESAGRDAMEASLEDYRGANGPGRVLFLLDSSGSMAGQWEGPSGGPGLLKQSLGGLGDRDEYAVWAVSDAGEDTYDTLLPFGPHSRKDAERAIDRGARVRDAEADPLGALRAALDAMEVRDADDERPGLIVFVTDDEDADRLAGDGFGSLLDIARARGLPVAMVSLKGGGCDAGKPDARISEAGGGRCLDADDDLGAALHDEVARTGTGET